ncbi:MAG: hypothetical protein AMXMBFR7_06380 [Planctomycetota bacterium]
MFRSIFRFCGSLKLAIILLIVLAAACAYGTIVESNFNTEVARAYVYNAMWFNVWLAVLIVNLFCAAMVRYPWKPHLTGFVITHAGIILLLIGGIIDRLWGIEGFVPLTIGETPTNIMELHEEETTLWVDGKEITRTPFKVDLLKQRKEKNFSMQTGIPGLSVDFIDLEPVAATITGLEPVEDDSGMAALLWTLEAPQMGGAHDQVLFLNQQENLGPATVSFISGLPPEPSAAGATPETASGEGKMVPRRERHYQFSKEALKDQVPAIVMAGEATGAKSEVSVSEDGQIVILRVTLEGKSADFGVRGKIGQDQPFEGLPDWKVIVRGYFPNFRMQGNQPATLNEKPENPAVAFELVGPLVKDEGPKPQANPHGQPAGPHGKPAGEFGDPNLNQLTFFLGEDGKLRYFMKSRQKGEQRGDVTMGETFEGFIPGSKISVKEFSPKARPKFAWAPVGETTPMAAKRHAFGLHAHVTYNGETQTMWLGKSGDPLKPVRQALTFGDKKIELAFAARTVELPFALELVQTAAPHQEGLEGSNAFAAFESTLRFEGDHQAKIYMNNPTTYPVTAAGPWLGTTYKFSQASHGMLLTPPRPDWSGIQVLRDPGWAPKWVGCLMICFGIFTMFYLKPYFKSGPAKRTAKAPQSPAAAAASAGKLAAVAQEQVGKEA